MNHIEAMKQSGKDRQDEEMTTEIIGAIGVHIVMPIVIGVVVWIVFSSLNKLFKDDDK